MAKNIEINIKNGNGYEILYPRTLPELTGCLPLTGGTMTGNLILNGDATNNLQATTLQQLNNGLNSKLSLTGGTMSGSINMNNNRITNVGNPSSTGDAVNKNYVDSNFAMLTALSGVSGNYKLRYCFEINEDSNVSINLPTNINAYIAGLCSSNSGDYLNSITGEKIPSDDGTIFFNRLRRISSNNIDLNSWAQASRERRNLTNFEVKSSGATRGIIWIWVQS